MAVNTSVVIAIILGIICAILFYRYTSATHTNTRTSGYEMFSNAGLVFGNPLIQRNGINIELGNFGVNSDKIGILLNSPGEGLTALASTGMVKISLMDAKKITALRSSGLAKYQILYSDDDITYRRASTTSVSVINGVVVNQSPHEIQTIENIVDQTTGVPITARFIKIINVDNVNAVGVKIELYGLDVANASTKLTLQSGASLNIQLYDEKAALLSNGEYVSDPSNGNTFVLIRMPENYDHLVNFISFKSNIGAFKIKYGHSQRNHVYTIPCNGFFNGSVSADTLEYFYFPNPTMVNYITIVPFAPSTDSQDMNPKVYRIREISVFGLLIDTTIDKTKYIDSAKPNCNPTMETFDSSARKESFANANPTADISIPFTSASQITPINSANYMQTLYNACQIQEQRDRANNAKQDTVSTKQYSIQAQAQLAEIAELEAQIAALTAAQEKQAADADKLLLQRHLTQKGVQANATDVAAQRLAQQEKLNVEVNLQTTSP